MQRTEVPRLCKAKTHYLISGDHHINRTDIHEPGSVVLPYAERMPLWKTILAYDGTGFHGWQVQPGLPTIQGTLAEALRQITGETVLPQGSGRTDSGVHALGQVASFALAAPIPPGNLQRALNRALPASIRILSVEHAPEGFHARHSARRKTYEYRLYPRVRPGQPDRICSPLLAPYAWDFPFVFDGDAANEAAGAVLGEHDFTSFAAADPDLTTREAAVEVTRSNVRTIFRSEWRFDTAACLYVYEVTGTGFLHHMVRNLVGTFVEMASGRRVTGTVPAMLAARARSAVGATAPARGLFLTGVEY